MTGTGIRTTGSPWLQFTTSLSSRRAFGTRIDVRSAVSITVRFARASTAPRPRASISMIRPAMSSSVSVAVTCTAPC